MTRHVARPLARRIDRLSRLAHRFHRWAHHPLCTSYAGELVSLGRKTRVCRGCLFAAVGLCTGVAMATCKRLPPELGASLVLGALLLGAGLTSRVRDDHRRSSRRGSLRPAKLIARWLPAWMVGFGLLEAVRAGLHWGAPCFALAAAGGLVLAARYRSRGPDRGPCISCPERNAQPCSGVAPIVLRERAFRRLAGRWLAAAK